MLDRFPVTTLGAPNRNSTAERDVESLAQQVSQEAAIGLARDSVAKSAAIPKSTTPYSAFSEKLLDAKVRLHQRLLDETNLSALEKLSPEDVRRHVSEVVAQYILADNLALNSEEFEDFVTEVLNEMTGLG